jgi:hypothetical protein
MRVLNCHTCALINDGSAMQRPPTDSVLLRRFIGESAKLRSMATTSMPPEPSLPMDRAASTWFLLATALCSGVVVAFTSWLAVDYSDGVRVLAAVAGLGFALALMLFVARALDGERRSAAAPAPGAGVAASPTAWPTGTPDAAFVATMSTSAAPSSDLARDALTRRLEEGRALREELDPGAVDARVDAWIEGVRRTIEQHKPGVVGYFDALSARRYTDDGDRLDAHIGRLATIVRDFLPAVSG